MASVTRLQSLLEEVSQLESLPLRLRLRLLLHSSLAFSGEALAAFSVSVGLSTAEVSLHSKQGVSGPSLKVALLAFECRGRTTKVGRCLASPLLFNDYNLGRIYEFYFRQDNRCYCSSSCSCKSELHRLPSVRVRLT